MNNPKQAILVVSFGTSYNLTRERTIDVIEKKIQEAWPQYTIRRAWTSKMIMAKLLRRDHVKIDNVTEAMERLAAEGFTDVIIQPTHVINGIENDLMKEDALAFRERFNSITFGTPLLTGEADNNAVIEAVHQEFPDLKPDEALVLMGHGTTHYANAVYAALDYTFKDKGFPNIFLGTVEAYPSLESLLRQVKERNPRKVILAPFMIVAGDHARNDMSGDNPESWRYQFEQEGFDVECVLKGLGEYPLVQQMFLDHVQDAADSRLRTESC